MRGARSRTNRRSAVRPRYPCARTARRACPERTLMVLRVTNHRQVATLLAVLLTVLLPQLAAGQAYPAKPVRVIVGYTPGGSNDVLARVVARHLQDVWKQPFVVENKPGASG